MSHFTVEVVPDHHRPAAYADIRRVHHVREGLVGAVSRLGRSPGWTWFAIARGDWQAGSAATLDDALDAVRSAATSIFGDA